MKITALFSVVFQSSFLLLSLAFGVFALRPTGVCPWTPVNPGYALYPVTINFTSSNYRAIHEKRANSPTIYLVFRDIYYVVPLLSV